jgi:hypothetical protein
VELLALPEQLLKEGVIDMAAILVLTPAWPVWLVVVFVIAAVLVTCALAVSLASSRIEHMADNERPSPYIVNGRARW